MMKTLTLTSSLLALIQGSLLFLWATSLPAADWVELFNGKTLEGWEGNTTDVWRVEDGEIRGGSMEGNPQNEFLATQKDFRNFELSLEYKLVGTEGFVNGGVQFWSQRIEKPAHEMAGFQADLGAGYTGFLYDESRRNRFLKQADEALIQRLEKPGDWNAYRIRAEGRRIRVYLNGELTVDYTEPDLAIPREGKIALQIHGDCKAVIAFRNIQVFELPEAVEPAQEEIVMRFGAGFEGQKTHPWQKWDGKKLSFREEETVVFMGQENWVRHQKDGWLETGLSLLYANERPRFRWMAWEADTVDEQWRDLNFGPWEAQLKSVGASTVVMQFGQIEALKGIENLAAFRSSYHRLIDQVQGVTPRIVLVTPLPFESPDPTLYPEAPDLAKHNVVLTQYVEAIREIARERDVKLLDLHESVTRERSGALKERRFTDDGLHLNRVGLESVSRLLIEDFAQLSGKSFEGWNQLNSTQLKTLKTLVEEKNRLWFDCWRPANWSFVYGDRLTQIYARAAGDEPSLQATFEERKSLVAEMDQKVEKAVTGQSVELPAPRSVESLSNQVGELDSIEAQIEAFEVAEGFEVTLFASEREGVVKPIQMTWDSRGRLFVACSPSYPQPVAGVPPSDYILMLEDRDGDGKAEISERFAEGLNMIQGLEFGNGGLYVCDFDRLLHLRDTDGDGRADETRVVLSGFGIGDTHQLINSIQWGPDGHLWFTQGLHAFSHVETPHGVKKLEKAGLWRLNPRSLQLDGFFNQAKAGHNCWGVAFDDHFQMFHKSGDRPHGYYSVPGLVSIPDPEEYHPTGALFDTNPKTTGMDIIGTQALPKELQGTVLIAGYMGNLLEVHRLHENGSGYRSEQLPRLLTSKKMEFRPVDVHVGPDGKIYMADWYNALIGHYQTSYADPGRDRRHGRIWTLKAKGSPQIQLPEFEKLNPEGLMSLLQSPERWIRAQARRHLFEANSKSVEIAGDAYAQEVDLSTLLELTGIFQAHRLPRREWIERLMSSEDARFRAYAARVAGDWKFDDLLLSAAVDSHPRVRLEAAVASAGRGEVGVKTLLQIMGQPMDPFLTYAVRQSLKALESHWEGWVIAPDPELTPELGELPKQWMQELVQPAHPQHPGQVLYESLCLNCHQADGKGLPGIYPPLASSDWLKGESESDREALVKVLLHGLQGEIHVNGKKFETSSPLIMPPMGLDDEQIAAVLNWLRQEAFGTETLSSAIQAEWVQKVRESNQTRTTPWTEKELRK